jgi:hypothetical protein
MVIVGGVGSVGVRVVLAYLVRDSVRLTEVTLKLQHNYTQVIWSVTVRE